MKKALVTGGAGFSGSRVTRNALSSGAEVVVLDNLMSGYWVNLAGLLVEFVEGDIRNPEAVQEAACRILAGVDAFAFDTVVRAEATARRDAVINCFGVIKQRPSRLPILGDTSGGLAAIVAVPAPGFSHSNALEGLRETY